MVDDDRLLQWSKHEPIVAIFVAIFVDRYSVMLAFKSTLATQWHINIEAPEVSAIFDSTKSIPYEIEMQQAGQGWRQPTEATIAELADLEPTDIMVKMTGGIWGARNVGESWKKKMTLTDAPCALFLDQLPGTRLCSVL